MNRKYIIIALLFCGMSACNSGGTGSAGGASSQAKSEKSGTTLEAKVNGNSISLSPKATAVLKDTVSDSVRHTLIFTNYELPEKVTKMRLQNSAREEGRTRVQIEVIGEKGSDINSSLKPGEYPARVGNVGAAAQSANGAMVVFSENGKENRTYLGGPDMKEGKVVISSVENGIVKGEVALQDGDNTLKGKFSAKL
jgi:hypothetical protein